MSKNAHHPQVAQPTSLKEILYTLAEAGEFQAVVLTCPEGLPIATVPVNYEGDATAAIVALFRQAGNQAQRQLDMAQVDELAIRDHGRTRLVCRYLVVGDRELILAVIVQSGRPYRRLTNQAIRQIEKLLSRA